MSSEQPKEYKKRCVLTAHDVQSIKDLVFIIGGNSESSAQKAIFEILADRMRDPRPHPAPADDDCHTCLFSAQCSVIHYIPPCYNHGPDSPARAARKAREEVLDAIQVKCQEEINYYIERHDLDNPDRMGATKAAYRIRDYAESLRQNEQGREGGE
jgi:hypothetical protein